MAKNEALIRSDARASSPKALTARQMDAHARSREETNSVEASSSSSVEDDDDCCFSPLVILLTFLIYYTQHLAPSLRLWFHFPAG